MITFIPHFLPSILPISPLISSPTQLHVLFVFFYLLYNKQSSLVMTENVHACGAFCWTMRLLALLLLVMVIDHSNRKSSFAPLFHLFFQRSFLLKPFHFLYSTSLFSYYLSPTLSLPWGTHHSLFQISWLLTVFKIKQTKQNIWKKDPHMKENMEFVFLGLSYIFPSRRLAII